MDALTTPLLTGTATGAILLLAALGLTLTFGQMGVINMANGEFLMVGAYVAYVTQQVISGAGISILVALPVAFVFAGLLGLLLEATVIQWMYSRPLDTLLATVGVSLVLQQAARDIFGAQGDPVTAPSWLGGRISVFGYEWPHRQLFTIVLALGALAGLNAVLKYSSFGRQIRATVQNRELAETVGVSTRDVDRITFFLGSGLAGVGGVAIALISGTNPTLGTSYIIPAFLVVLVIGLLLWEPIYYLLQLMRWEKDWPAMFFMIELIPEAILAWYVFKWIGPSSDVATLSTYLWHIIPTWIVMWLFVLGPIKTLFIRWRFNGGRIFF